MIDTVVRPYLQPHLFDPLAKKIGAIHWITPKRLSLLALVMGLSSALSIAMDSSWIALVFLSFSALFDILDGSLARLRSTPSIEGAFLDVLFDRTVESAIVIALYSYDPTARGIRSLLMLAMILLCVTSFLLVGLFTANGSAKSFHYSPGLMERTEAFFFFALLILYPSWFNPLSDLFIVLLAFTTIIRGWQFLRPS